MGTAWSAVFSSVYHILAKENTWILEVIITTSVKKTWRFSPGHYIKILFIYIVLLAFICIKGLPQQWHRLFFIIYFAAKPVAPTGTPVVF